MSINIDDENNLLKRGFVISLKDIKEFEENINNNTKIRVIINRIIERIERNDRLVNYKPKSIIHQINAIYNALLKINKVHKKLSFESVKNKEQAKLQYVNSMFMSYYLHELKTSIK